MAQLAGTIDVTLGTRPEQMAALSNRCLALRAGCSMRYSAPRQAGCKGLPGPPQLSQTIKRGSKTAAEEQMRLANQVHDSISGALRSLLGQSKQFETQTRQMAQATLQSALVIAKAGGSLSNFRAGCGAGIGHKAG